MVAHVPLCLDGYLNAEPATFDANRADGGLNAWGNSFPAEEIPFGAAITVGGVNFRLPEKRQGAPDHIEALGQRIVLPTSAKLLGLGLLCFGEMGTQRLSMDLAGLGREVVVEAVAPTWLVDVRSAHDECGLRCSHLH